MWKTNNFDGDKTWYSEEEYNCLKQVLREIKSIADFAQCLPCGDTSDCKNCTDDEVTNFGQFCMYKRIEEIKEIISEVLNEN